MVSVKAYQEIAEKSLKKLWSDIEYYQSFLDTSAKFYRYKYADQVLIHAQRPQATACAEYDTWIKIGRYIKRGSKGIALIDDTQEIPKLHYVFDYADTAPYKTKNIFLWSVTEETKEEVLNILKSNSESVDQALIAKANELAEKYASDYSANLEKNDTLLEELDDLNVKQKFRNLLETSISYVFLSRCGYDPHNYFSNDDFINILDFNSVETISLLGTATAELASVVLTEIECKLKDFERSKHHERKNITENNRGEWNRIHSGRTDGDISSEHSGGRTGNAIRQIRFDEENISQRIRKSEISGNAAEGNIVQSPEGNGSSSKSDDGTVYKESDDLGGSDRRTKIDRSNEMGRNDEQHQDTGRGNNIDRSNLHLDLSQENIDIILTEISERTKCKIYEQYQKNDNSKNNISFLKNVYSFSGGMYTIDDGRTVLVFHDSNAITVSLEGKNALIKWSEVDKRLRTLINNDRYLNKKDKEYYPKYLSEVAIQKERSERIRYIDENGKLPVAEKRGTLAHRLSNFFYDMEAYEKKIISVEFSDINNITAERMEDELKNPISVQKLINGLDQIKWKTSNVFYRSNSYYFIQELKDIFPMKYLYNQGDIVYLGADTYEIADFNNKTISLSNTEYPLLGRELFIEDFENKLRENTLNDHLKKVVTDITKNDIPTEKAKTNRFEVIESDKDFSHIENVKAADETKQPVSDSRKQQAYNNISAIQLLNVLKSENRSASADERKILIKYVGWGGLPEAFDENNKSWSDIYNKLKTNLTTEDYRTARESTLTAFYTPSVVTKAIYDILDKLNFSTGSILEPSCGVGDFFKALPIEMKHSKLYGVEIDNISGNIAKQLYPKANIAVQGFEKTELPDDHFDVVLGNVPFGDFKVSDRRYDKNHFLIHDYFFAKALDKVHAGGIVAFITSKGTMDKKNSSVRKYISQRAELLGAIRLPNDTFKKAGTKVTSDILILQKRDRMIDIEPNWVHLDTDKNNITMNSYFVEHPEMVLGSMETVSTAYGFDTACLPKHDISLEQLLHQAVQNIDGKINVIANTTEELESFKDKSDTEEIYADPNVRNYSYGVVNGSIYYRENDKMLPVELSGTAVRRIKGLVALRDCVRNLIKYQAEDYPEDLILAEQKELNRLYDRYVEKYGMINSKGNYLAFSSDESYFLLCSLEILDDDGNFKQKADMFSKRTIQPHRIVTYAETSNEALAVSISEKANVDIDYMMQLTGKTKDEIINDLRGIIFKLPEEDKYITADEYLSGDVRAKLVIAEEAAKQNPEFRMHVEALKKVQPADLPASEINVRLGTTWIPKEDIQKFIVDLLSPSLQVKYKIKVNYSAITGAWSIENKNADYNNIKSEKTYGTKRASAYHIIEDTLNLRDVRIYDYVYDDEGKKQTVLNQSETMAAQAKQDKIKQEFKNWIWNDPDRRNRLVRYYNDTFNSTVLREYNGSYIKFGGMNPEITLKPHQVNAVAHILYGGNTLLAHKVGAGKTFEMIAAAQESKRLGLCNKSMIVVPNHLVGQWSSEYLRLYPSANILVTTKKDFEKNNRKKFCSRIATGDYDAVIIGHSQFEKIPVSVEFQKEHLEQQLNEIKKGIVEAKETKGENFTVKQLVKMEKSLKEKLKNLNNTERKDNVINFEELGIDRLFIDESHFYKNLFLYTKMRNVSGISQTDAQKSSDLFMKCRYLDGITGNRGIVFATGTPISNSIAEMYTVQRYLQYNKLIQKELKSIDNWASTFCEPTTSIELTPEGTSYRAKTRLSFYNIPELMQMFKETADIKTADMLNLPVPTVNYKNISVKPSEIQKRMVSQLADRAERIRDGAVDPTVDNMLKITNDGRKLALDQRIIDPMLPDDENSKVNVCVNNIFKTWADHMDTKAAQLVFCDLSTPKSGTFSIYDDIKTKLIDKGIPKEQICFIHDAPTDAKKKELFAKVRSGDVRVLIGSTQKMGAGTNVQDRLIAIHNIDCPWRPSDLEQRQGRIERQGNMFQEVDVYRYVTEQTFDAYLYQLVENKQKFISQIMTSKNPMRAAEDIDESVLSYAEIKMLATGDLRMKERTDLFIQVSKLRTLKNSYLTEHYDLEDRIMKYYPKKNFEIEKRILGYESDIALINKNTLYSDKFSPMKIKDIVCDEKETAGKMLIAVCKEFNSSYDPVEVGKYRGLKMELYYDVNKMGFCLNLCGKIKHKVMLGLDEMGNITRIDNELARLPEKLEKAKIDLKENKEQLENAKIEVKKPFEFEAELTEKSERLNALNMELSLTNTGKKEEKESVLSTLKKNSEIIKSEAKGKDKIVTKNEYAL